MPTYLIHGFRWRRDAIRIHVAFNNLEDATPDWVMAPATSLAMHESFYKDCDFLPPSDAPPISTTRSTSQSPSRTRGEEAPPRSFLKKMTSRTSLSTTGRKQRQPSDDNGSHGKAHNEGSATAKSSTGGQISQPVDPTNGSHSTSDVKVPRFNEWSAVKLLEQYDLDDQIHSYQEYAYVGDYILGVPLGVSISEQIEKYQEWIYTVKEGPWIEKLRDKLQAGADIGWYVVVCDDEDRFAPEDTEVSIDEDSRVYDEHPRRDSKTGGLKSFFKKKSVDLKQGAVSDEAIGNHDRLSRAEAHLLQERKRISAMSPKTSPTAP